MLRKPKKYINRSILLTGAVIFLLLPSLVLAETREKEGQGDSFPAIRSLQNLLLKHEKDHGLIPTTLGEKKKWPENMTPSKEEIARLAFGEYLIETGNPGRAAEVLEKLIGTRETGPFIRMAREALQRAYYRNGEYQKSLGVFYNISSDRKSLPGPGTLLVAGNSYLRKREFRPALETLSRISPDRTHYPFALYSMGLALSELEGDGQDPVWTLRKLVRLNPGDDPALSELVNRARLTLAIFLKNQNKHSDALDLLGRISPESRAYPGGLYGTGILLSEAGSCVRAIVVFEKLLDQFPVSSYGLESLFRIGVCFSNLKAFRNAVDRFHIALTRYQEEKTHLENVRSRIRKGETVSIPEIQLRFLLEVGVDQAGRGKTWAMRFREMAHLETRAERIAGIFDGAGGERIGEANNTKAAARATLESAREKAREELESAYLAIVSGQISKRILWIEDLTQRTTLQMARHIILIQDYETIR